MGDCETWDYSETNVAGKAGGLGMTITITKAGVAAWFFAVLSAVLFVAVYFQGVQNDAQSDHIATLKQQNVELTAERDALSAEVARLKKLGSVQGATP